MQVAQRLYEGVEINGEAVGLITYMRTDGVQISQEALSQTRDLVNRRYGSDYLPEKPAAVRHQGQERPGGARGRASDRPVPHGPKTCAAS